MKYKLVQKGNPQKPTEPKKWYANAVNQGVVRKNEISHNISGRSSLTRGDIGNVLDNLIDELPRYLASGNSVQLGDFGTFRLSISSEGAESKEKFNSSLIKKVKIIFTPGSMLKKELADIGFELDNS